MPVTQIFTSSGTWTVPATVYSVQVECIGGGGRGGTGGTVSAGGGGAGGSYARKTLQISPGQVFTVTVGGSGQDSWFSSATTVIAKAGASTSNGAGALGSSVGCIGDVVYAGGSGVSLRTILSNVYSGGGGGGAGSNGPGGDAGIVLNNGGSGTSLYGGNGGDGTTASGTGNIGNLYGGGGAGSKGTTALGAFGGNGVVVLTYEAPGLNRSFIFY